MWRALTALQALWRVPGGVDTEEGHGLKAGLLRKLLHEVHQSGRVVELAQVDVVSHSLPVGHDPHLETRARYSPAFPPFFSSQTVLLNVRSGLVPPI